MAITATTVSVTPGASHRHDITPLKPRGWVHNIATCRYVARLFGGIIVRATCRHVARSVGGIIVRVTWRHVARLFGGIQVDPSGRHVSNYPHGFTTNSIADSQRSLSGFTTDSQRIHNVPTTNSIADSQRSLRGFTTFPSQISTHYNIEVSGLWLVVAFETFLYQNIFYFIFLFFPHRTLKNQPLTTNH